MIDPRAVAYRHVDPQVRAVASLTVGVTENPWRLTSADLNAWRSVGLSDAEILHAILQAALFGHFTRIADATGVATDYPERFGVPKPSPGTPSYLRPVDPPAPAAALDLSMHAGVVDQLAKWSAHAVERDEHIDRRRRAVIRAAVANALGDRSVPASPPTDDLDNGLVDLAETVILAPWNLGPSAYAYLRTLGHSTDAAVFDVVATASSCGLLSRIAVTLSALAR